MYNIYVYSFVTRCGGGGLSSSPSVPLNILCLIPGPHLSKMPLLPSRRRGEPLREIRNDRTVRFGSDAVCIWSFDVARFFNYAFDRCDTHGGAAESRRRPCETSNIFNRRSPKTINIITQLYKKNPYTDRSPRGICSVYIIGAFAGRRGDLYIIL